jgi:hypothetical protein
MESTSTLRSVVEELIAEEYVGASGDRRREFRQEVVAMLQAEGYSRMEAMKFWLDCVTRVCGRV